MNDKLVLSINKNTRILNVCRINERRKRIFMNRKMLIGILPIIIVLLNGCFAGNASQSFRIDMNHVLTETNIMPIAVIGSGPAGLMASIYGARGGKKTYVIEGNKPGGLLMDTTEVENWPGETSITGPHIIEKIRKQAEYQGAVFVEDTIERVDFNQWPFKLHTENGNEFTALSVVIATGAHPRKLGVPGEDDYWGSGVTSCAVCDAPFFKDESVVVVGGGDSAIEEAIQLTPYAKHITILVRKDAMRAAHSMQDRLKDYDNISVKYNVEIQKIIGDGSQVTGVSLYNNKTKRNSVLPTSGVFLAIGHIPNSSPFKEGGIQTDNDGYIQVKGRSQQTSVPGVFAAGDVQDNHYRQASSSAGDGTNAGLDAVNFLDAHGYTITLENRIGARLYSDETLQDRSAEIKTIKITGQEVSLIESRNAFEHLIDRNKGLVVVLFYREDCPQCIQMRPIFEAVAHEYTQAEFAMVNTDQLPKLVEELFIEKVPCVLMFKEGSLVARYSNMMSRKELSTFINQLQAPMESPEVKGQ